MLTTCSLLCSILTRLGSISFAALSAPIISVLSQTKLLCRVTISVGWLKVSLGSPLPETWKVRPSAWRMSLIPASLLHIASLTRRSRSLSPFSAATATMQSPRRVTSGSLVTMRVVLWLAVMFGCPRALKVSLSCMADRRWA